MASLRTALRVTALSKSLSTFSLGLFGIVEDRNSSFMKGPAKAPSVIRRTFDCDSRNMTSETGVQLGAIGAMRIKDFGDVEPADNTVAGMYKCISPVVKEILSQKLYPLMLGGDHSVTYPVVKAVTQCIKTPVTIVHFDAHPDFYPTFQNNPASHASPFARIMEHGSNRDEPIICEKLISIGIRTLNAEQAEYIRKQGERREGGEVTIIEARNYPANMSDLLETFERLIPLDSPVYISVDIDVLDPAYAPGVSHRESGGLSVRQVVDAIQCIPRKVLGADVVEYNVDRDVDFLTASAASKILKELAAKIISSQNH